MFHILITTLLFGTDNLIKHQREENPDEYDMVSGNIHVTTYHNYGAFLNLGDKKTVIVKAISLILTLILSLIFVFTFSKHGKGLLKTGLAILLGGAFSNTYDRLKRGYVVDYLNFPKAPGKLKNVIFNISDFAILIGALIATLHSK